MWSSKARHERAVGVRVEVVGARKNFGEHRQSGNLGLSGRRREARRVGALPT